MSNKYPGGIITSGANAGYSVAFDGNGDSLTAPQSNSFRFSGNFTIEAWVYANSSAGGSNYDGVFDTRSGNVVSSASAGINYTPSGYLNAYVAGSNLTSSTLLGANRWVHVALVRSGSAVTLYQNGISVATGTTSANLTDGYCTVGGFVANGYWNGYISNVRVVNGTAVYSGSSTTTANFALPTQLFPITNTSFLTCQSPAIVDNSVNAATITANGNAAVSTFTPFQGYTAYNPALGAATPGIWSVSDAIQAAQTRRWNMYDPYFNYTTLLLHGNYTGSVNSSGTAVYQNNDFLDSSSNNFTITRNGNTTQGTFSPFSQTGWSNYFNNSAGGTGASSGNYLTTNVAAISSVGASDFSIECFVYALQQTQTTAQGLVSYGIAGSTTGTSYLSLELSSTGYLGCAYATATSTTVTDPALFPINQWVHVVVCRSGSTLSLYVNGIRKATATTSATVGSTGDGLVIGGQWYDASKAGRDLNGYMSNVRIVKGSSAYDATQSTLTVPTSPLTAITNTSLLTCQSNRFVDNSSNGYAISVFSNVQTSVQAFSPFLTNVAYTPTNQGGSGYFDGTGDFLNTPTSANLAMGSGDFTIECWVYTPLTGARYIFDIRPSASQALGAYVSSSSLYINNGSTLDILASSAFVLNAWNHFAYVRSGSGSNNISIYLNGSRVYQRTDTTNYSTSPIVYIAADNSGSYSNGGYISGFRILKGTAQYSGATITLPTAPPTAITNTQLLLNFTNAGIVDSTAKNALETVGNAQISTTQSKFGGSSMYFDGTGYLKPSGNQQLYRFGTGDFTVEMWVYLTSYGTNTRLYDGRPAANGPYLAIQVNTGGFSGTSNALQVYVSSAVRIDAGVAVTLNSWFHLAVCRSGTSTKMFVNGTQSGSTYTDSTDYSGGNAVPTIGASEDGNNKMSGYIDDLRISRYARYTANFTPQTSQWQDQ